MSEAVLSHNIGILAVLFSFLFTYVGAHDGDGLMPRTMAVIMDYYGHPLAAAPLFRVGQTGRVSQEQGVHHSCTSLPATEAADCVRGRPCGFFVITFNSTLFFCLVLGRGSTPLRPAT